MKPLDHIQAMLLRICIRPFEKKNAVSFRDQFQSAGRALILLPDRGDEALNPVLRALDRMQILIVSFDGETTPESVKHPRRVDLDLKKRNLWTFYRSEALKQLCAHPFDLFIDLNPTPDLLGIFLSRKLGASLRICMAPHHVAARCNLIYNPDGGASYSEKVSGCAAFIRRLLG